MSVPTFKEGLEDVVVGTSAICLVDGKTGKLIYRGYDVHDLCKNATFEEVVYLLWHGELPTRSQLDTIQAELIASREVPGQLVDMMRGWPRDADPMEVLRSSTSLLSLWDPDRGDHSAAANLRKATRLTARMSGMVTAWEHIRNGRDPIAPDPGLNHAANFLYTMTGKRPPEDEARILDISLILHADHELNASTFACRVTVATLSDMYSAITSGVGTLSGPLHGGANTAVMKMLLEIDRTGESTAQRAADWASGLLKQGVKISGFGHRVYRTEDPRATWLRRFSEELGAKRGESKWYEMSRAIEERVKAEKGIWANVDFYSASTHYMLGLPTDQFTPFFAVSRVSGWTAHVMEQLAHNRLIRPRAEYTGYQLRSYQPIESR
ncbi:MAG: citrate synthase [Chloroflexi bacterium]|nr:citrate synthase [Chloroflexota bacterium]